MGTVVKNHQVLEPITNEEIDSIKTDLINKYSYINNTITREDIVLDLTKVNINTLGDYIFTYIIPKANIYKYEGVIKVRDLIPPTITGDVIYTIKGEPIDIWNYITVSDNFYSVDEITKGYTEIDQVNINVPGSYRVKITVTYTDGTVLLNGRTCSDSSTKYVCPNSGCYGNDSQCHWYNSSGASCPSAYGSSKYNY